VERLGPIRKPAPYRDPQPLRYVHQGRVEARPVRGCAGVPRQGLERGERHPGRQHGPQDDGDDEGLLALVALQGARFISTSKQ
jgi:hypothetical protein